MTRATAAAASATASDELKLPNLGEATQTLRIRPASAGITMDGHAKNLDEDVDETDRMDDKREHKSRLHSMKEMKDLVSNKIHLNKLIIQSSYLSGHKFEERTVHKITQRLCFCDIFIYLFVRNAC